VVNGLTVFPVKIRVPLSVSDSSRENAIRTNVGKQLETMTLVQLEDLQNELEGLVLINPDWPICIAACDTRSMATLTVGALLQAVQGEVDFRKMFPGPRGAALEPGAPSVIPPAPPPPAPGAGERLLPSAKKRKLLWAGALVLVLALVK
jgi:hypothetical protein